MLAEWMIPTMNAALVVGVGVVLPLGFSARVWPFLAAALFVAASLVVAPGVVSASLVAPWVLLSVWLGVSALRDRRWWAAMAAGFSGTASLALVTSHLQLVLFDIHEPIVKLTALHFTYAGAGTLLLADRLATTREGAWTRAARWLVFVAPPVVASGFVTKWAVAQVGGALVMTAGAWAVAALQAPDVVRARGLAKALWACSVLSPWVAMGLGVSWAAAQYWPSVPALTVPDMVPTHGALNAFGFVLAGHLAAWRERRSG